MITLHRLRWFERELHTRIPFKYGIATMVRVPHVWLEIDATIAGQRVVGQSADHLPPKWFTKDPTRGLEDEVAEMKSVLTHAGQAAVGREAPTVHALMQLVETEHAAWAAEAGLPNLLSHFGVTFVERALIDAFCRRHETTVGQAMRSNGLGIDLADLHPELAGMTPAEGLPTESLAKVASRHTVGLGDPLEEAEVAADERPSDDLPVSLRAVIRHYGLHDFKIKVAGEIGAAVDRLEQVTRLIAEETGGDYVASLDGNETFQSVAQFREFWELAQARPNLAEFWSRLLFVEQPIHRDHALDPAVGDALRDWTKSPPLLIDESGATPEDLRRALDLGYIGVSHKNCKGVIHGLANRCLLARRGGNGKAMSGEDLSNVGPIALPQDLAVQAALGNASVERNGHHYFNGLSGWPEPIWSQVLERYHGLYTADAAGCPRVKIDRGSLNLGSVNRVAFGGPVVQLGEAGKLWLAQG
jgi:L-alanine-DL-glutamate epimerase-like enolase superfamily enzyme